jgi:hypothetical protein
VGYLQKGNRLRGGLKVAIWFYSSSLAAGEGLRSDVNAKLKRSNHPKNRSMYATSTFKCMLLLVPVGEERKKTSTKGILKGISNQAQLSLVAFIFGYF